MYEWFDEVLRQQTDEWAYPIRAAKAGASVGELDAFEREFGIALPRSYREFLARWNGWKDKVFSTTEVQKWHREWGAFKPFSGEVELCSDGDEFYVEKPRHFLTITQIPLGSDILCLDTRPLEGGEFPIFLYDIEWGEQSIHFRYPSFEAMILHETRDKLKMSGHRENDYKIGPEANRLIERLTGMLTERGAAKLDDVFPDWSGWR